MSDLRERLARAFRDEAPVWDETFPEGNTGLVMGVADAEVVAVRTVAVWLCDYAEFIEIVGAHRLNGDPDEHRPFIVDHLRWLAASLARPDHTKETS